MIERSLLPRRVSRTSVWFGAAMLGLAAVVGALSAISAELAVAGVVATVAVPAAIFRPKLIAHLLVVSVFAEATRVGGITIGRLVAPLAATAVLFAWLQHGPRVREARATIAVVIAFAFLAIASYGWSLEPSATVQELGGLAIALTTMAAFAVLPRTESDVRSLLWTVAVSSVCLGLAYTSFYVSGVPRQDNPVGDPNFFAAFEVMALPLVLVLASSTARPGLRFGLFASVSVLAATVVATLSRGGFAALVLTVAVIVLLPAAAFFRSRQQKALFFVATAMGLMAVLSTAFVALQDRFERGFSQGEVASGRSDLWRAALVGFDRHPVTGLGYGAFKAQSFSLLSQTPGVDLAPHLRSSVRAGEPAHSAYLDVLAELGPGGLVLFLSVFGLTARSLIRTSRRAGASRQDFLRRVANGLLLSLLTLAVSSGVLSSGTSRGLWFVIGLAAALPRMAATPGDNPDRVTTGAPP